MAGPFGRILANLLVVGVGVVSKAFMQAYQQAVANAKSGKTVAQAASTTVSRRGKMDTSEALQILNFDISDKPSTEQVRAQFEKYFAANEPANGGSFYLQSKIYRAKEALEYAEKLEQEHMKKNENSKERFKSQ